MTEPPPSAPEEGPGERPSEPSPEHVALARLLQAFKRFLIPFLSSWALAYIGSNRQLDWLYFVGLGGVGLSMMWLMIWLIS